MPRRGPPWPATWRSRPGRAGAGGTAPPGSTASSPRCGPGSSRPRSARSWTPSTATAATAGRPAAPPDRWSPGRAGRQHLEAALLEAGGDPAAALDAYLEALAHADVYRAAYRLADCHQGAARCLLALGDEPGALDHARQAGRLLERWPGWRRDEAAALLRRLGGGPASAGGPGLLTPREREVAALLADGLSNGEIARRLYISTKTASVHVSNILAKLDMTSRTEVATWAVRTGLVPLADPQMSHRP